MADESMARNLAAQAEAIWPQERPLLERLGISGEARILDAGCGTGEASARLAALFPRAGILGVDVLEVNLDRARDRCAALAPRVRFENRSVYGLGLPDRSFDLVVCRHVIQAIPHAEQVLAELARVIRRGGRLHLIAEDYGMVHFPGRARDALWFWREMPSRLSKAMGIDLHVGRRAYGILRGLGLSGITLDYLAVDTLRVPRETFAAIWTAWRDGYSGTLSEATGIPRVEIEAHFDDQIATLRDPEAYAAWLVPVLQGTVP